MAQNAATTGGLPFAAEAPVSVSTVGIRARDVDTVAAYYRDVLGLEDVARRPGGVTLGAGGRPLLEIEGFSAAKADDPRKAGLFHTAFLLPSRTDLARWAKRAIERRTPITGASDHLVSEAIYLDDPEGNGIEIYADRPPESWSHRDGGVAMATEPLDLRGLLAEVGPSDPGWQMAPDRTIVGHVHLRVGDAAEAERWWNEVPGFDTMARYGDQAVFLATGGYHHHVGANSWRSRGAGARDRDRTGLSFVTFRTRRTGTEREIEDPWGNVIRLVPDTD